jgi:hypothetical protein
MRRSLVLALTLFALLWQGVAGASLRVWSDMAEGAEHAGLHWTETSHHHDDDGGYEVDDSSASIAHLAMDGTAPTILTIKHLEVPRIRLMHGQPSYAPLPLASPYLAPFQRPPRF